MSTPERVPTSVGVNVTPTVHFSPAPTLGAQVLLATAKSPVAAIVVISKEVARWLVNVTVEDALVVPMVRLAKVTLSRESVAATEPVPLRFKVCGLLDALSTIVSVPTRAPAAVGENVTPILQVAPATRLAPHVLLAMAKSPVGVILVNVNAVFSLFATVTSFAALVLPTVCFANVRVAGETVMSCANRLKLAPITTSAARRRRKTRSEIDADANVRVMATAALIEPRR